MEISNCLVFSLAELTTREVKHASFLSFLFKRQLLLFACLENTILGKYCVNFYL